PAITWVSSLGRTRRVQMARTVGPMARRPKAASGTCRRPAAFSRGRTHARDGLGKAVAFGHTVLPQHSDRPEYERPPKAKLILGVSPRAVLWSASDFAEWGIWILRPFR